jgi:hypothetical protein
MDVRASGENAHTEKESFRRGKDSQRLGGVKKCGFVVLFRHRNGIGAEVIMRTFLFSTILLGTVLGAPSTISAQQVREVPPQYRGPDTQVHGVFVTPIAGVPFTAKVLIESEQTLPDGTVVKKHTVDVIARDSTGKIHNEQRLLVPDSFQGMPPLLSEHVFDPATRANDFCNPATRICREQTLPPMGAMARPAANPNAADLGVSMVGDFEATGSRATRTIPAQVSGTGKPVEITDETWYSEDLHMNLKEQHTDPRSGVQTVTITSIQREEPDATLFAVPEGYKVVDMTPPARETATQAQPSN